MIEHFKKLNYKNKQHNNILLFNLFLKSNNFVKNQKHFSFAAFDNVLKKIFSGVLAFSKLSIKVHDEICALSGFLKLNLQRLYLAFYQNLRLQFKALIKVSTEYCVVKICEY